MNFIRHLAQKRRQRGHSVIEVAFLAPWIFFLFVGVVDVGFYCYAAINTQNAARSAALYMAQSTSRLNAVLADKSTACQLVISDLWMMRTIASTPFDHTATCGTGTSPALDVSGPASLDGVVGQVDAVATVTFQMLPMIPIPGLTGTYSIQRTSRVRVNSLT